jgi:hypothetical protein
MIHLQRVCILFLLPFKPTAVNFSVVARLLPRFSVNPVEFEGGVSRIFCFPQSVGSNHVVSDVGARDKMAAPNVNPPVIEHAYSTPVKIHCLINLMRQWKMSRHIVPRSSWDPIIPFKLARISIPGKSQTECADGGAYPPFSRLTHHSALFVQITLAMSSVYLVSASCWACPTKSNSREVKVPQTNSVHAKKENPRGGAAWAWAACCSNRNCPWWSRSSATMRTQIF